MKAKVIKAFTFTKQEKTYQIGDTFNGSKEEIDYINIAVPEALEEIKEVEKIKKQK